MPKLEKEVKYKTTPTGMNTARSAISIIQPTVQSLKDESYIVIEASDNLTNERVLEASSGITITDIESLEDTGQSYVTVEVNPADLITAGSAEVDGDKLDIDWTPTNYTPSTSPSEADNADNLTAHLYGIDQILANAQADLSDEQYLVLSASGDLSVERIFTAGDGLDGTDSGAGAAYTVDVDVTDLLGNGLTESSNNIDVDPAELITGGNAEVDGDKLDVDWTPSNYTPSTSPAEADNVDNLTAHLYGIDQELAGIGTDLSGEPFVTASASGNLSAERVLTAGDGIDVTDGGAGTTITVDVDVTDILGNGLTESSNNIDVDPAELITGGNAEIDGDKLDIDWTPTNYTPSTSPAEADNADNLTAHLYGIDQELAGTTDISGSQFVVMALSGDLSAERVLTAGDGLDLTDGGANGNATLAVDVTDVLGNGLTESSNNIDVDPAQLERAGNAEIDGDHLDIDWNPSNYTPSTSPGEAANVDDLTAHLYGIDQAIGSVPTDISGSQFVVMALSGDLSAERVLTAGDGLDLTDGGANGNATLAVDVTDILGNGLAESSNNIYVYELRQSDDGAAALSADASGDMTAYGGITFNAAESIATNAGDLTLAPAGDIVLNPTGNDVLPTTNWDITLGSVSKKYKTLHAGELAAGSLVEDGTASGISGRILVAPTTILTSDLGSAATSMTVEDNEMASGDTAYLEAGGNVEFILISDLDITGVDTGAEEFDVSGDWTATFINGVKFTVAGSTGNNGEWTVSSSSESGGTTTIVVTGNITDATVDGYILYTGAQGTGPYTYLVVTRNRDASGANDWYAGDFVANTGAATDSYIEIFGGHETSILGTDFADGGSIVVGVRQSATYNDIDETIALRSASVDILDGGYVTWREDSIDSGDAMGWVLGSWGGGAGDDITIQLKSYKATGITADDVVTYLVAEDVDASTVGYLALESSGQISVGPDFGPIANANMTIGLCINQDTNDDEIMAFKSADVAHGMTSLANTDTYGTCKKVHGASGGLGIAGYKDADGTAGLALQFAGYLGEAADTTKSTAGIGVVRILSAVKSGTSATVVGSDGNLLTIQNYSGTRFIFDAEGSAHADVEWTTYDEEDDLALLDTLETALGHWQADPIKGDFGEWLAENGRELERLKLVNFDRDNPGHVMLNTTRLLMLLTGACRQLGQRVARYESLMEGAGA